MVPATGTGAVVPQRTRGLAAGSSAGAWCALGMSQVSLKRCSLLKIGHALSIFHTLLLKFTCTFAYFLCECFINSKRSLVFCLNHVINVFLNTCVPLIPK